MIQRAVAIAAPIVGVLVFVAGFTSGYDFKAHQHAATIAAIKDAQDSERARAEQRLAEAVSERDTQVRALRADNVALGELIDRMREANKGRLSTAGKHPCKSLEEENARLRKLLERSASLLGRGAAELGSLAADHDALASVVGKDSVDKAVK